MFAFWYGHGSAQNREKAVDTSERDYRVQEGQSLLLSGVGFKGQTSAFLVKNRLPSRFGVV